MSRAYVSGVYFRWVVPQLSPEVWSYKEDFKAFTLDRLKSSKTAKKQIKYYTLAIESHADGKPHLDLLLIFEKRIKMHPTQLDFLCQKHGDLTRYRNLNSAVLAYGYKQDTPLTNLPDFNRILDVQDIKRCPVTFLMRQVDLDPFGFSFIDFCLVNKHFTNVQRWSYVKTKIKDYQQAKCNSLLRLKCGVRFINDALIRDSLTSDQYVQYHSQPYYAVVVSYLNQISLHGWERPFTSKQLYISGRTRIGKSYLIRTLSKYISAYPVGTQNWFPRFTNFTYSLMTWDQCDLQVMSMQQMLQLFDGDPFNLPYKGGSILKRDNQLWLMCSNKTLLQQFKKAGYDVFIDPLTGRYVDEQLNALMNRFTQVVIPDGCDLNLLLKLIVPLED